MNYLQHSYSSAKCLSGCARMWELNKQFQHPGRTFESIALTAGTLLHECYQEYLVFKDVDRGLWHLARNYPHLEVWDSGDDRSWEALMATFLAMVECDVTSNYRIAEIKCPDGKIRPAIEVPFELIFDGVVLPDGRGVSFIGYIDCIMIQILTGRPKTLDIKTHRSWTRDRTALFKYDTQQIPYGIALEHLLGNVVESFDVEYLDCFIDICEPRADLYTFTKNQTGVQEWLISRVLQIKQLIQYMQMDFYPRTDGGCMIYNRPCKYLDICESRDKTFIQSYLLMDAEPVVRDPIEPWIQGIIEIPKELMI